jgi:hypothetical protein
MELYCIAASHVFDVAKGLSMAFVLPSIGDCVLHPEVLAKWESLSLTLPDWNEKFFLATSALNDILPVSSEAIEIQEEFIQDKSSELQGHCQVQI